MKFNKWMFGLLTIGALVAASAARAQTTTTNVPDLLPPIEQAVGVPPAAAGSLPPFNKNGLDFTNVNYKAASGLEYETAGGTMAYLQFDADLYHGSYVDLGLGAEGTLSGSGSGLHTLSAEGELIKNFSNFQLVGKAGVGGVIDGVARSVYGAFGADINYNLTSGASISFLGGASGFTYVGAGTEFQVSGFSGGNAALAKVFRVYFGFAF
jgi:hypothetical protein